MKLSMIIILAFIFVLPAQAQVKDLAACHRACFEAKRKCNNSKPHTFNSCEDDLVSCKRTCNSGKKGEYGKSPELSFHPILNFE